MKTLVHTTIAALALTSAVPARAQEAKVSIVDGHFAPLSSRITYRDGKTRDVIVVRSWYNMNQGSSPFMHGVGDGNADVKIWLDTVSWVKATTDKEYTLVMKNGSERTFGYNGYYTGFVLHNPEGGSEFVSMNSFKTLEFLGPARKDSRENAMFDHWKFSPYTGEKLADLDR